MPKKIKMTEQEKKVIAQSSIRGLGGRDGNLLRSIMSADVVWILPGEGPMSGEARGVDAILKRANTLTSPGFFVPVGVRENPLWRVTSPSFCTTVNERVYITAIGCEIGLGGTRGLQAAGGL
jgi:hypothetical protein